MNRAPLRRRSARQARSHACFAASLGLAGGLTIGPVAACSARQGTVPPSPSDVADGEAPAALDAGASADAADAAEASGGDAADDGVVAPPLTNLRIAHVSAGLPSIDVCVALHGTGAFEGPLLAQLASSLATQGGGATADAAGDAGLTGVGYAHVSAYVSLAPGSYDVRLVPAGAGSCAQTLSLGAAASLDTGASAALTDWTTLPALAMDGYATLLVAGDVAPVGTDAAMTVRVLPDDAVLVGAAATLRAVNAMPGQPEIDLGIASSTGNALPILTDVAFGGASAQASPGQGVVDANGYLAIAPFSGETVDAWPSSADSGAADALVAGSVDVEAQSIATLFAMSGPTGDDAHPPILVLCVDNQPSAGLLSDCSVEQP